MYVGNRHTATVEKLVSLDFACKECGLEQLAIVVSWGEGQGNSAFFLDESGAKGRAASSAGEAADKNARKMLALARCPQCFAQDESALRSHRMNRWLLVLAVIVGCGLFGALLAALIEPAWGYGIAIFSGAFGLWAGWVQMSAIEQGAANRVVFPSADGEDEQDDAAEDRQEWNLEGLDLADEQEGEDSGEDDFGDENDDED